MMSWGRGGVGGGREGEVREGGEGKEIYYRLRKERKGRATSWRYCVSWVLCAVPLRLRFY